MKNFLLSILNNKRKDYFLMTCVIVTYVISKELPGNYGYIGLSLLFIESGIFVFFLVYDIARYFNRNKNNKI